MWTHVLFCGERERLEQPEVVSGTVSVSLSCPEFSVKDGNERAGRDRKEV